MPNYKHNRQKNKFKSINKCSRWTKWRRTFNVGLDNANPNPGQSVYEHDSIEGCRGDVGDSDSESEEIESVPDYRCNNSSNFLPDDPSDTETLNSLDPDRTISDDSDSGTSSALEIDTEPESIFESDSTCYEPIPSASGGCVKAPSETDKITKFLQAWAVGDNVPLKTLDNLLKGLKEHSCFKYLPACGRTIVQTPVTFEKRKVLPGDYIHLGVKYQIQLLLKNLSFSSEIDCLNLMVNVDGLPPFKSSQGEFYPILLKVLNIPEVKNNVLPVGLYYGPEKPADVNDFLKDFVEEMKTLTSEGIEWRESSLKVLITAFCCDAPAKSYVMGIIGHNGFYSCTRCTVKGETVERRRVFLDCNCPKRTHTDFISKTDLHYQCRDTILTEIPGIDFVNSFVIDYMHQKPGFVRKVWDSSNVRLKDFLSADVDVDAFIKDNSLEYLTGEPPQSQLSMDEVQDNMIRLMQTNTPCDKIFQFISSNVGDKVESLHFIRALITAICTACITDSNSLDLVRFKEYEKLVQRYVDNKEDRELACLSSVNILSNRLDHPQGLIKTIFNLFLDNNLISCESFLKWKDDDTEKLENKGVSLYALTSFFSALDEVESEDENS